jgi:hypothetical protein
LHILTCMCNRPNDQPQRMTNFGCAAFHFVLELFVNSYRYWYIEEMKYRYDNKNDEERTHWNCTRYLNTNLYTRMWHLMASRDIFKKLCLFGCRTSIVFHPFLALHHHLGLVDFRNACVSCDDFFSKSSSSLQSLQERLLITSS